MRQFSTWPFHIWQMLCLSLLLFAGTTHAVDAKSVLKQAGVNGGLVVHIGCGDGKLTADLHANDAFIVQGLDTDKANVLKAREHVSKRGLYGRVSIELFHGKRLPYIDNMVNLIVVDGTNTGVAKNEILRVLAPLGVAIINGEKLTKPWPEELDEWPHWLHGPDNNAVSTDKKVGISRHLQWVSDPAWSRHHNLLPSVAAMVSARGRLYSIVDEAPIGVRGPKGKWALVCRDAFNGLILWRRSIENWSWSKWSKVQFGGVMRFKGPDQLFRRLVAAGNRVFVTLGFNEPVSVLDGATGQTIKVLKGTENTAAILHRAGKLYLTRNVTGERIGKDILAVDAESGAVLWERKGYAGVTSRGDELKTFTDAYLTVGAKRVFFLDGDHVMALDLASGKEAWKSRRPTFKKGVYGHNKFNFGNFCTLVYQEGLVFFGQIHPNSKNLNAWQEKDMDLLALDAESGKALWRHTGMTLAHFTPPDVFVNKGLVWTMKKKVVSLLGLDVRTGEVKKEYPAKSILVGHHHRCYRNKATQDFYLAGEEGIEYIDFDSGAVDVHHWMRGACAYGILPANGLIYLPTHACGCHANTKLNGFFALSAERSESGEAAPAAERLEKGPAFGEAIAETKAGDQDWPVFKHDNRRSNHTAASISPKGLKNRWTSDLGGRLSPPIVAANSVFLARKDANTVHCLDAESGTGKWSFIADGGVDTPPTYAEGRIVFGSRGGSVYALNAENGELIWHFRAAPHRAKLLAHERLESVWPVIGSVLVMEGKAYCIAGRSMHLDSGLFAYVLDVKTGKLLQETPMTANTKGKGELGGAVLPDLLVSDGNQILMRSMRFLPEKFGTRAKTRGGGRMLKPGDGGLLDSTWYNSAFWMYAGATAQMLVFDDKSVYGVAAYKKQITKSYGHDACALGSGYRVFRANMQDPKSEGKKKGEAAKGEEKKGDGASKKKGKKKKKKKGKKGSVASVWKQTVPVRAHALVLANDSLFLAGAPDQKDKEDPWGAFEDRKGGRILVLEKADGKKTGEVKLASTPVYDGMAAANGCLFLSLKNGSVVCIEGSMP